MLTDLQRELIAAALDGDLAPDQDEAFRRLLDDTPAARTLYDHLRRDRDRLRALPRTPAPPSVHPAVMAHIRGRTAPVVPTRPAPRPRRSLWLSAALAASFFLCVGGASFLYFQSQATARRMVAQTHSLPKDAHALLQPAPWEQTTRSEPRAPEPRHEVSPPPRPAEPDSVARVVPQPPRTIELAPPPSPAAPERVLTSPIGPELPHFQSVQLRLPVLIPFADLAGDDARRRVADELAHDPAYRIDVFATDPHAAAEALVAAAGAVDLSIAVDAITHERLRRKLPFGWAVLVESLTPADVAAWLAAAARDRSSQGGSSPSRVTATAHFVPAGPVEQREWKELLGVEPGWGRGGRPDAPTGPKPITSGTADQVANSVHRSAASAKPQKHAVLVTYLPREGRVNAALSREVRQYAETRGERKPNTVPLLIAIRATNP